MIFFNLKKIGTRVVEVTKRPTLVIPPGDIPNVSKPMCQQILFKHHLKNENWSLRNKKNYQLTEPRDFLVFVCHKT